MLNYYAYMDNRTLENPVFAHSAGLLSELEKEITESEVKKLERLGYLENAISPKGETWRLSKKGKMARKAILNKSSWYDCLSDFFFRHILHYHVSL